MADLRKLIEAVEAGTLTKTAALGTVDVWPDRDDYLQTAEWIWRACYGSLDAAKALHDALLPGWGVASMCQLWDVGPGGEFIGIGYDWSVELHEDRGSVQGPQASATASNPARAWLLAVLHAMALRGDHG